MMDIGEYKLRVISRFKHGSYGGPTKDDWQLLAKLFLDASENGEIEEFDHSILNADEFNELYEIPENMFGKKPGDFLPTNPGQQGYDY